MQNRLIVTVFMHTTPITACTGDKLWQLDERGQWSVKVEGASLKLLDEAAAEFKRDIEAKFPHEETFSDTIFERYTWEEITRPTLPVEINFQYDKQHPDFKSADMKRVIRSIVKKDLERL